MTKQIIEKHIKLTACEAFDWTPRMYDLRKEEIPYLMATVKPQGLPVIVAALKLLLWILDNLFNEDGKLSIPIWKWPKVVMAVRDFINDLKKVV